MKTHQLFAQVVNPITPDIDASNPESAFGKIIAGIIGFLLIVATIWTFLQLLIGGFNWISSSGDKGKLEAAQQRIQNAIVGLAIVFAAWAIFIVVLNFFGITQPGGAIQLPLPKLF